MGPIQSVKKFFSKKTASASYDYIIVGGGTAGCVLANRLSEAEDKKILVIEAGSADFKDKFIRIPAGIMRLFQNPKFDWNFNSAPEPSTNNREIYLCRGKVLGGSSCLNVLLYHRGNAHDYQEWENLSGSNAWGPQTVLPYFKKSEDDFRGESEYHGTGGELSVSNVRYRNPLTNAYFEACAESGFNANDDFNNWSRSQEGYGVYQVMERNGERCSTASGFLKPVMKRKNLSIITSAMAEKVVFEGNKAVGIDVDIDGKHHHIALKDGGEVLLSGGALNSPQLLMLSGIGPKEHIEQHGISCLVDLPAVGKNLQDHPASVVSYSCSPGNEGVAVTSKVRIKGTTMMNPRVILQWLLRRSGPLTSVGCDNGGFFKTEQGMESPDLQMRFLAAKALSPDGMSTFAKFREQKQDLDGFSFQSIVTRPHSRGAVELKSSHYKDQPLIKTGYFTDERDLKTIREGLKLSRKLAKTSAFAQYIGEEVYPGEHVQTDDELDEYIKSWAHTSNALVGTCRLGKEAHDSVVGPDLKVHGLDGIRVIDASVMPKIPGGQTAAPTIMIAEKAADFILNGV